MEVPNGRSNVRCNGMPSSQGNSDMDHSHVNGAINLTTITSSTSPSESPNETPSYQSDYEPRTEEQDRIGIGFALITI
ncbi:hypothetical protein Bhyg_09388 [Pseudolycoriella hygida]|uniref:Uncharacterized protein n=1 Tax=Pseudolycoriella hygida TaxID=35572 RepID=A0A9Q0N6J5_9DIPT|nr:hypothetical protein Bhyg_09388 [Pseudolycoriella hygida]